MDIAFTICKYAFPACRSIQLWSIGDIQYVIWCHIPILTLKKSPRFAYERETLLPLCYDHLSIQTICFSKACSLLICCNASQPTETSILKVKVVISSFHTVARQCIECECTVQEESRYHFMAFGKYKHHELRIESSFDPDRADKAVCHLYLCAVI